MSLKSDIYDALKALVSLRVYPNRFPQQNSPTWPAIRYSMVSGTTWEDLCGDGGAEAEDPRVQIDWVADSDAARDALTPLIRSAMTALGWRITGTPQELFDEETKTFRATADWILYQST